MVNAAYLLLSSSAAIWTGLSWCNRAMPPHGTETEKTGRRF